MASLPSTASAGFQTDVPRRNAAPQAMLDRPFVAHQDPGGRGNEAAGETGAGASGSSGYLDNAVEGVNRQIDNDIKALLDAFDALVELSGINDKDRFRIAQEKFEAEARADTMVRAAQSLTLLSHSLKLSLLLAQEPVRDEEAGPQGVTLDEEAIALIESTAKARQECAKMLLELCGLQGTAEEEERSAEDVHRSAREQGGAAADEEEQDEVPMQEGQ